MATSLQIPAATPGSTVNVDAAGALAGDGTIGTPLAVIADGDTITVNGSDELVVSRAGLLASDTTIAHTALVRAYDVDGTTYRTFVTLTNANVPTCNISQPTGSILAIVPPAADPHVAGAIWNNAGTLTFSAG